MAAIDPLQIGAKRIEEKFKPLDVNIEEQIRGGAALGGTFAAGLEKQNQREQAAEFEKLLQTKQKGMLAFIEEAEAEGFDLTPQKEQIDLSVSSPKAIAGWYDKATKSIEVQKKAGLVEKATIEPTAVKRAQAGVQAGIAQPKDLETAFGAERAELFTQTLKDFTEKNPVPTGEELTEESFVEFAEGFFKENPDFLKDKSVSEMIDVLEGSLTRASRERAAQARIEAGKEKAELRKDKPGQFGKEINKLSTSITFLNAIDSALPQGIFGENKTAFGVAGFGTKVFRKFLNTKEAIKLRQAVQQFFLGKTKEQSGVAVNAKEMERLESAFGLNNRSTVEAFIEGLRLSSNDSFQRAKNLENTLLSPESLEKQIELGTTTSRDIPQAKGAVQEFGSFEEAKKANLGKGVPFTIKGRDGRTFRGK